MHRNRQDTAVGRHASVRTPTTCWLLTLAFLATVSVPVAAEDGPDATVTLHDSASPTCACPTGWFTLMEWTPGDAAEWTIELPQAYTVVDIRMSPGQFETERATQVVPLLHEPGTAHPLFGYFPRTDVWNAQSPVRLYHHIEHADTVTLRLGIPGPTTATLRIERDVTPPGHTLGPIHGITHFGFHQNTTTDEFAIGDLQWRPAGSDDDWIVNPTPSHHTRQIFPIQGMQPDTLYDVRAIFTDWAGNQATSDTYQVRTLARPAGQPVLVSDLSPPDGSTVSNGELTVRAVFEAPAAIDRDSVRLFIDLTEVPSGFTFDGRTLQYRPAAPFAPGPHVVSVDATSTDGGTGAARWTFTVAGAASPTVEGSPGPAAAWLALLAFVLVAARRAG